MALYMLLSHSYPLSQLQSKLAASDCLMLAGDGVYQLPLLSNHAELYVRAADIEQRGLNPADYKNATCINDNQWVELTLKHQPVVSLK